MTKEDAQNTPEAGIILVDPRTPRGQRYLSSEVPDSGFRVLPYTYIRACILRGKLLSDYAAFRGVQPIFECQDQSPLKIHIHKRLEMELSDEELANLKLDIAVSNFSSLIATWKFIWTYGQKHGGNSATPATQADVILARNKDLKSLRQQWAPTGNQIHGRDWVQLCIAEKSIPEVDPDSDVDSDESGQAGTSSSSSPPSRPSRKISPARPKPKPKPKPKQKRKQPSSETTR